jgi:DMSO/TMAO reductase YedYZ molybdopterin-dependent catalytic subunit
MTHEGFKLVTPPDGVHALTERLTADSDVFLVTHMGLAAIEPETWWLDIEVLVDRPTRLTLADLASLPTVSVTAIHECAGSPLAPTEPKRRVGNVTWSGVPLSAVLAHAGVRASASFIWSEGLEWGSFAGMTREAFVKDPPLWKVPDALLARHLKGESLSPDRVGPVRLVVPGWAWAECGVAAVEVSVGDDAWRPAELAPRDGFAWQHFSSSWTPLVPGRYCMACRCVDMLGRSQSDAGARNAVHAIEVEVAS